MNSWEEEDLTNLAIFHCQVRTRRLQIPIIQLGQTGNICGNCFCKLPSANNDITENVELERLMAKLRFPCNYHEDGCTFHGSFYKICDHEKGCRFKKRSCPFVYIKKCEADISYSFDDIIAHIREDHPDSILMPKDQRLRVTNPSEGLPELLYFIDLDGDYFLLRTKWNECRIVYAFSRFFNSVSFKMVKFTSAAFFTMPSNLGISDEGNDMFIADLSVLKRFNLAKEITVSIYVEDVPRQANVIGSYKNGLTWLRCTRCKKFAKSVSLCTTCKILENCGCGPCSGCYSKLNQIKAIDLVASNIDSSFPCGALECPQWIRGDKYDIHANYHCHFQSNPCLFCKVQVKSQREHYTIHNMINHLMETHKDIINQKEVCIMAFGSEKMRIFNNDANIFIQKYNLASDGLFSVQTIKMTEPYWDSSYVWKINFKKNDVSWTMSISGDCTLDGSSANVNVPFYLENHGLTFYPFISHV